jgi:hypothetical protein
MSKKIDNTELGHEEYDKFFATSVDYLTKNLSNEQLGALLKEYVEESAHSSWEGYENYQVRAIYEMFVDMATYHSNKAEFDV